MRNHADDVEEVEIRAPSVSEAIQKGLIQLGATRDDVRIEVLNEGSRGILGIIGVEDARVRLRLRRPRPRQPEPEPVQPPETEIEAVAPSIEAIAPSEEVEEEGLELEPEVVTPAAPEIDAAEIAIQAVRTLVQKIGVPTTVEFRQRGQGTSDQPILIDVEGEDLGVLIGHQGSTLQALQFITRLIVSRQTHEWTNIVIDVGGYRQRRERSLRELAQRMADRVRENGRPISLEPMPPNERRIIHLALRDNPDVATRSVGQGDNRKVTIRLRN
ncbi:MAG: RNA-binding cell elongation regulator Jag/EloR [Anaerolineae bacterium]